MLDYYLWPGKHSEFFKYLGKFSLRKYVENKKELTEVYKKLVKFRQRHAKIVHNYIIIPAREFKKTKLSEKGTGGSNLMPFLNQIIKETENTIKKKRNYRFFLVVLVLLSIWYFLF